MTRPQLGEADRVAFTAGDAPAPLGPYSHAIGHAGTLYCSGQIAINPVSGRLVGYSPGAETTQCLKNLAAICHAAGGELSNAVRVTVYTTQLEAFEEISEAYREFFTSEPPARVTVGVVALPMEATVEIDAVVALT